MAPGPIGLWALFQGVFFLLMGGVVVVVVIQWYRDDGGPEQDRTGPTPDAEAGPPLESWREVYDVDKAEATREVEDVAEQAKDLSEAEKKSQR